MNWKQISGYEDYEVSDTGLVRSLKRGGKRVLSPKKHPRGYLQVVLCKDGEAKHMLVHRLVAEAFIPNPQNLPTVNHKDENKRNNAVSNLEWMSVTDNIRYSNDKHSKNKQPVLQLDLHGNIVSRFPSMTEAERQTGISDGIISSACRGGFPICGYFWRYA